MESLLRGLGALLAYPVSPSVSVAIALWLAFGLVAARFNLTGWWRRRLVLERAIARQRPEREIELARQRHEAELIALLVQIAFLSIGVLLATSPPDARDTVEPSWQNLAAAPIFIAIQVGLAVESWRQHRYDERRLAMPPVDPAQQATEGDLRHA